MEAWEAKLRVAEEVKRRIIAGVSRRTCTFLQAQWLMLIFKYCAITREKLLRVLQRAIHLFNQTW